MPEKGFTLAELVIVIVIVGIIAGIGAPFISTILDAWLFNKDERDLVFSARLTMNRMVREIRQIKDVSSIVTFTADEFKFTHINNSSVDFKQSGNVLLFNSDELTNKLQNPGGLHFDYLKEDSINETTIKSEIRMVRITLTLVSGDNSMALESLARFRNI